MIRGSATVAAALLFLFSFLFVCAEAGADIYVYKDSSGVLHFTNAPSRAGYRTVIREWGGGSELSRAVPGRVEEVIRSASDRYGVDPNLVRAVIKAESDFNSAARSPKGARGLMQLMPETARLRNVNNVYDPAENIDGGVRHLKYLLDHFQGDLRLTLAGYNAGVQAVEKYGGVPPYPETKEYIRRVLDYQRRYRGSGSISIREESAR